MPVIDCTKPDGSSGYKIGTGPCIYDTKAKATAAFVAFLAESGEVDKENLDKAVWTAAFLNDLPDAAFAFIKPGGEKDDTGRIKPRALRTLPHHNNTVTNPNDDKSIDMPHLNNALARVSQTTTLTEAQRATAKTHLEGHKKRIAAAELAKIDLAEGESIDDLENKIRIAVREEAKGGLFGEYSPDDPYDVCLRAVYDTYVIVHNWQDGKQFKVLWSRGIDNAIELDTTSIEPVKEVTVYEPIDNVFEKKMISGKDGDNELWKVTDKEGNEGFYYLRNNSDLAIIKSIYGCEGGQLDEADQQPMSENTIAAPSANFEKMNKAKLFKADKKRGIFTAVVLSPYMIDVDEDWASPLEIEKTIHKFMEASQTIGKGHVERAEAVLIESSQFPYPTIADENAAKASPQKPHKIFKLKRGEQAIHSGDWVMTVLAKSDALKKEMGDGNIAAFSIGGSGIREKIDDFDPMAIVTEVIEIGE